MKKYKIIAICGEAGTGKDTLFQSALRQLPDAHEIISCTTRPMREGEAEGVNYYYLTPEKFADKVVNDEMLEATCFNDWFYGTSYDSLRLEKINIGVFNPDGVRAIMDDPRVEPYIVRVICDDKTRLLRQLNREEHPDVNEIIRRFGTDKSDFMALDFDFIEIRNETLEDLKNGANIIVNLAHDIA